MSQDMALSFDVALHLGTLLAIAVFFFNDFIKMLGKGLTKGTKDNEEYSFFLPLEQIPTYGMCTDVSRFYTFYKNQFMEFYPEREIVELFFLATEELHRLHNGKWQDFKFEK